MANSFPFQIIQLSLFLQLILLQKLFAFQQSPTCQSLLKSMHLNNTFEKFIRDLLDQRKYKYYLKKGIEQYDILKYKISNLTPLDIKKMYQKITLKYFRQSVSPETQNRIQQNVWLINQLKIFVWITTCYAFQAGQRLSSFNLEGWKFLISVFYFKPLEILQYQLLSLLKGDSLSVNRKWTHTQNQLLKSILMDPQLQNKWNQISKLFYFKSGKKYFRKPQKCRQHWYNHLNPSISHKAWTLQEDLQLIEHVNKIGNKWSQVSMLMGGHRTQHMIKNRFNSLQKKFYKDKTESNNKQIEPSILISKLNEERQTQKGSKRKIELMQSGMEEKNSQFFENFAPLNIEKIHIEEESMKDQLQIKVEEQPWQNLVQICEDSFFVKTKRSLGLMSEIDEGIEKYVDYFLF